MLKKISIFIISSWFSMTCLIDFLVVPFLFKNTTNFFETGKLAINLFYFFNLIEIAFAGILLLALFKRGSLTKYILSGFLLGLTLFYHFYLIPGIAHWAMLWEAHAPSSSFEHQLYRYLDILKIAIIGWLLIIFFKDKKLFKFSEG